MKKPNYEIVQFRNITISTKLINKKRKMSNQRKFISCKSKKIQNLRPFPYFENRMSTRSSISCSVSQSSTRVGRPRGMCVSSSSTWNRRRTGGRGPSSSSESITRLDDAAFADKDEVVAAIGRSRLILRT